MNSPRWRLLFTFALTLGAPGCGARSSIPDPQSDAGAFAADASTDGGQRSCAPNCTVGHECCAGGCDGPAVQMPSDCCACLAGEVSSFDCGGPCAGSP
jgi:hypothetical protein